MSATSDAFVGARRCTPCSSFGHVMKSLIDRAPAKCMQGWAPEDFVTGRHTEQHHHSADSMNRLPWALPCSYCAGRCWFLFVPAALCTITVSHVIAACLSCCCKLKRNRHPTVIRTFELETKQRSLTLSCTTHNVATHAAHWQLDTCHPIIHSMQSSKSLSDNKSHNPNLPAAVEHGGIRSSASSRSPRWI